MTVFKRIAIGVVGVVGLVIAAAAVGLAVFDWNDARGFLARQATAALGREVTITGPVNVELGDRLRIHVEGLAVANPSWAEEENFAELAELDAQLRVWPLLRGSWIFPEVRLTGPRLALEKNSEGATTWTLGPETPQQDIARQAAPDDRAEIPIINQLVIVDGRIRYRDPASDIDIESTVATVTGDNGQDTVSLQGQGGFAGKPFRLNVSGGALRTLRDGAGPYPVRIDASVGDTHGTVEGAVAEPVRMEGVDLSVRLNGPDLAAVFPIFGIPMPTTRPFDLSGHVTRDGSVWRLEGLKGRVGQSDLDGTIALDTGGERPMITGDLTSHRLAAEDLAGFVGASPRGRGDYPTRGRDRVIPATPVNVERLRFADMDVRFRGERVEAPFAPLDTLSVHLVLDDGRLSLEPLALGIAGGRVAGTATVDARGERPDFRVALEVSGVKLSEFFKGSAFAKDMGGIIGGRIHLAGAGRTVADILASANGEAGLAVNGGRVTNLAEAGLKTNVLETLGIVIAGDEPVRFNCLVADLDVKAGTVVAKAIVLDTTETLVTGRGRANLRDETLDLTIIGDAKEPQVFATEVPVHVGGHFAAPRVTVDPTESVARGVAAVALGVLLTPLAAILPTLDEGDAKDANCAALIRRAGSDGSGGASGTGQ